MFIGAVRPCQKLLAPPISSQVLMQGQTHALRISQYLTITLIVLIVNLTAHKLRGRLKVGVEVIGVPAQARMQRLGTRRCHARLRGSAGPLHSPVMPGKFGFLLYCNVLNYF